VVGCTDEELIRRLHDPEQADGAWNEVIALFGGLLEGMALKKGFDDATAEDIVQVTFENAVGWVNTHGLRADSNLRAWLCTICANAMKQERRRYIRRDSRLTSVHGEDGKAAHDYVDPSQDVERALRRREVDEIIQAALAGIRSPAQRRAVLRRLYEEIPYEALESEEGLKHLKVVVSRAHRVLATDKLRELLN
jgi:RNA polymerase sigma factor (sigma-70 family)